jgi:hypothetical protein
VNSLILPKIPSLTGTTTAIIGIALTGGIALASIAVNSYNSMSGREPQPYAPYFTITYVLLANIFLILIRLYTYLEAQQKKMPSVKTIIGEQSILNFLKYEREETKGHYLAMWCFDKYDHSQLKNYYEEEASLRIKRCRLINTAIIDKSKIKEHLRMFSNDISNGNYNVYPTTHRDYEIIICYRDQNNTQAVATMLIPDFLHGKIDLAIYSDEAEFVRKMESIYRDLQSRTDEERFKIDQKMDIEKNIDSWLMSVS